jgi:hypothetical protein
MFRQIVSGMMLLSALSSHVYAHGLVLSEEKTLLFDRQANIMVKVELVPNDLQYNQSNSVQVSVIDISESGFVTHDVNMKVNHLGSDNKVTNIFSGEYPKGIFKQIIPFQSGGMHELELQIDAGESGREEPFLFQFALKDNKSFARTTILMALVGFVIFTFTAGLFIKTRMPTLGKNNYS